MKLHEHVLALIDAIDSGQTLNIEKTFGDVMSIKMESTIKAKHVAVATGLFNEHKLKDCAIDEETASQT